MKEKFQEALNSTLCRWWSLCFLIGMLLYWPTLFLDWALVDEARFLDAFVQGKSMIANGTSGRFTKMLMLDHTNVGPVIGVSFAIQRLIFGDQILFYHLIKIVVFSFYLLAIARLAGLCNLSTTAKFIVIFFAAFFNPTIGDLDIHSYYANFARTYTTDSWWVPPFLWALVHFLQITQDDRVSTPRLTVFAVLCLIVTLTKISAIPMVACLAATAAILFAWPYSVSRQKPKLHILLFAISLISCIIGLLFYQPWAKEVTGYEEVPIGGLTEIIATMSVYIGATSHVLFYLWIFALLSSCINVFSALKQALVNNTDLDFQTITRGLLLSLFAISFILQSMWPYHMMRYMITFVPYIILLTFLELEVAIHATLPSITKLPKMKKIYSAGTAVSILSIFLVAFYLPFPPTFLRSLLVVVSTVLLLGLGAFTFFAPAIKNYPHLKTISIATTIGLISLHGIIAAVTTYEAGLNYYTRERAENRLLLEMKAFSITQSDNQQAVLYVNLLQEKFWGAYNYATNLNLAPNVTLKPLEDLPTPFIEQPNQRVFIIDDPMHGQIALPAFAAGAPAARSIVSEPAGNPVPLESSERLSATLSLNQPVEIAQIYFRSDSDSWPAGAVIRARALSLATQRWTDIGSISGRQLSRQSQQQIVIRPDSPVPLPANQITFTIESESVSATGYAPKIIGDESAGIEINIVLQSQPKLSLMESQKFSGRSLIVMPPAYLLRTWMKEENSLSEWLPISFRPREYTIRTQLYGTANE